MSNIETELSEIAHNIRGLRGNVRGVAWGILVLVLLNTMSCLFIAELIRTQ